MIALYKNSATASRMQKNGSQAAESPKIGSEEQKLVVIPEVEKKVETTKQQQKQTEPKTKVSLPPSDPPAALGEPEVQASWGGRSLNVYRREVLYKEVWQFPVVEVAKKYAVSDVTIHKICRSLDIPTPPPGYWAKLRAGKGVSIPPLPKSDRRDAIIGSRTEKIYTPSTEEQIQHLSEEDRTTVMVVASQIVMVDEQEKMNPKVAAYYKKAKAGQATEILDSIAKETLPRAVKILDTLVKTVLPLGIEVDDKLRFAIGKDSVSLRFSKSTTEVPHQLTNEEKMSLLEHEDAKKHKRWAREPRIRKYDHIYNGTLSLGINGKRKFRDSKAGPVEECLGEALIAIFYCINEVKLAREERKEAERKQEEERLRQEEIRKRHNEEVAKTNALVNQADDFEIATKIRAMTAAAEANGFASGEWIAWAKAKAKADWYDPLIAATDEYFGKRNHKEATEKKEPRER